LVEGIARGRLWLKELVAGEMMDTKQIAEREGCSDRFVRMTLSLAFLNPQLVKAAVEGRLPHAAGISTLFNLRRAGRGGIETLAGREAYFRNHFYSRMF